MLGGSKLLPKTCTSPVLNKCTAVQMPPRSLPGLFWNRWDRGGQQRGCPNKWLETGVCRTEVTLPRSQRRSGRRQKSQDHPLFQKGSHGQKLLRIQKVLAPGHILRLQNFVSFGWLFQFPENCHTHFENWTATLSAKRIEKRGWADRGAEGSLLWDTVPQGRCTSPWSETTDL